MVDQARSFLSVSASVNFNDRLLRTLQCYLGQKWIKVMLLSSKSFGSIQQIHMYFQPTPKDLSLLRRALGDHQFKLRIDYDGVTRPKITKCLHTQQMGSTYFSKKK